MIFEEEDMFVCRGSEREIGCGGNMPGRGEGIEEKKGLTRVNVYVAETESGQPTTASNSSSPATFGYSSPILG